MCHGPAGLVNTKLSNGKYFLSFDLLSGKYLVEGKTLTCFTNEEEKQMKLDKEVPFLLESKLQERGAKLDK